MGEQDGGQTQKLRGTRGKYGAIVKFTHTLTGIEVAKVAGWGWATGCKTYVWTVDELLIILFFSCACAFSACKRKDGSVAPSEEDPQQPPPPKKPRLVFTDLQRRTLQAIFKVKSVAFFLCMFTTTISCKKCATFGPLCHTFIRAICERCVFLDVSSLLPHACNHSFIHRKNSSKRTTVGVPIFSRLSTIKKCSQRDTCRIVSIERRRRRLRPPFISRCDHDEGLRRPTHQLLK